MHRVVVQQLAGHLLREDGDVIMQHYAVTKIEQLLCVPYECNDYGNKSTFASVRMFAYALPSSQRGSSSAVMMVVGGRLRCDAAWASEMR